MKAKRIHRRTTRTRQEQTELRALRERFQRDRPTEAQLLAGGDWEGPVPHGLYLELMKTVASLKRARLKAGLSLTEAARRSGLDKAQVSRLENGTAANPSLETLARYAAAVGKGLRLAVIRKPASVTK